MNKDYFYFKSFYLNQYGASLKICTDSSLFGAWLAEKISLCSNLINGYEIGTGIGLLSLLIAFKNKQINIKALDIDAGAILLAQENKNICFDFSQHIEFIHKDCCQFNPSNQFDFIFSNPPFYNNEFKSSNTNKNITKHQFNLNYEWLLNHISDLLNSSGVGSLLIPDKYFNMVSELINHNDLFLHERVIIYDYEQGKAIRNFLWFSKQQHPSTFINKIIIKTSNTNHCTYHQSFKEIMKDFSIKIE